MEKTTIYQDGNLTVEIPRSAGIVEAGQSRVLPQEVAKKFVDELRCSQNRFHEVSVASFIETAEFLQMEPTVFIEPWSGEQPWPIFVAIDSDVIAEFYPGEVEPC